MYNDKCLSRTQIFEWRKRFKKGGKDINDEPRPGRPVTLKTDDKVEKEKDIRIYRRLSIRQIAELVNID